MKRIFFFALALSLTCVSGRAQVLNLDSGGGGGAPGSDFAVLSKLFGKVGAFSA